MMTTKDPSVRWISNAYYWVFPFFSIFFSKFGVYTKGRAKVVGYVLEREKSPNLPRFSELSIGRVGFSLLGPKLCEEIAREGLFWPLFYIFIV